jgi:hypothetical protein
MMHFFPVGHRLLQEDPVYPVELVNIHELTYPCEQVQVNAFAEDIEFEGHATQLSVAKL